ncbi:MAG TPA: hypothetical protein VN903_01015 [Polyangia bacterium]|nr:hypothetical protein [Polyangia bacterium]
MARIVGGAFKDHQGDVVSVHGDKVKVKVSIFGRETVIEVFRSQVEMEGDDPRRTLRAQIAADQKSLASRDRGAFWRELARQPEGDAVAELTAFETHCQRVDVEAAARTSALEAAFDAEIGALASDDEVRARVAAEEARWFPAETALKALQAEWRANPAALEESKRVSELAAAREQRARRATFDCDYRAWRDARWSDDERARRLSAAEAKLAERRPLIVERFQRDWGVELPDALFRFWVFFQSLQASEREVFGRIELAPFGIMDFFERPDALPCEGIDVRVHGRFYRDPPEMLTFMHGGSDGLHFGLCYEDGQRSSGVLSYYNNDGDDLRRSNGTPLMVVREWLEISEMHAGYDERASTEEIRDERFRIRLAREAVMRFETADRPEEGEAYDRAYAEDRPGRVWRESDPTRDSRALVGADDATVAGWADETRRQLAAGDPIPALSFGRDLHWMSGIKKAREGVACDLLAAAYRALGRSALAGIAEAHHRHRSLKSVDVLEPDPKK